MGLADIQWFENLHRDARIRMLQILMLMLLRMMAVACTIVMVMEYWMISKPGVALTPVLTTSIRHPPTMMVPVITTMMTIEYMTGRR